jgi:hypothetical protein
MISVHLLDDTEEALSSRNIDTFSASVIVEIVSVVYATNAGHQRSAV